MKKLLAVILIALVATLGIWYVTKDNSNSDEQPPIVVEKDDEPVAESNQSKVIKIVAVDDGAFGVKETSDFNLSFASDVTEDQVRENLEIQPLTEYELDKISDKEYVVKPTKMLNKNQIYVFNYKAFDYGKAFQVVDDLKIYDSYPGNDAYDVPVRTTIELYFNSADITDISDYFEISPKTEGEFQYDGEKVMFVSTELDKSTDYTVTVKSGLSDGERITTEDYSFKFKTAYGNQFSNNIYYSIFNTLAGQPSVFKVHDWMNGSQFGVNIYKTPSFEAFDQLYKTFDKSQKDLDFSDQELVFEGDLSVTTYNYQQLIDFPALDYGRYIVEIKSEDSKQYVFMHVDDHQIYYTKADNGDMFWIVDDQNNTAEANAIVFDGLDQMGSTNENGLLFFETEDDSPDYRVDVKDKSYLVKTSNPSMYYDDYGYYDSSSTEHWSFIYTDREAYQMTDEIHVFGFVRSFTDDAIGQVTVKLTRYWSDDAIGQVSVELDEEQTFNAKINIDELETGYYKLSVYDGDNYIASKEINVRSFEKPEVYLTSKVNKTLLFSGESISYELQAKYFTELPFEDLGINFYYSRGQKEDDIYTTDENGLIQFDLDVDVPETNWYPTRYYISAENYTATDTYLYNSVGFEVLPRRVMIQTETETEDNIATVSVSMNEINIDNFSGNYGNNYENIKGNVYDQAYEVVIKDYYTVKTFVETVYDPIHKTTYDRYDYDRRESYIEGIKGQTVDGVDTFTFDIEDDHNYEVQIKTIDTLGQTTSAKTGIYRYPNYYFDSSRVYQLDEFDNTYDIGDTVHVQVLKGGQAIETTTDDFAVHMILRNGIIDYVYTDEPLYDFEFRKEHRPNIFVKTLYFDGNGITVLPEYGSRMIRYDYQTLSYDIEYETDKDMYGPSDTMTLNLDIKQGDKPFNGVVNVSVVDEAFFALYEDLFDLAGNLHRPVYNDGIIVETYSGADEAAMTGAEMGEGGDGDYIRDDFKDTAAFTKVSVVDGKASIDIKLPDNLTSWRLTMHAVNKELEYASIKGNVIVKLPYFVRTLYNKQYISGDNVYVTLNSDGDGVGQEDQITYKAFLKKNGITISESTKSSLGKGNTSLPIGLLEKGEYSVVVEAETLGYIDGVKEDIEVKDTYIHFNHARNIPLTKEFNLKYPERSADLYIYNQGALDYLHKISDTRSYSKYRIEEILGGFEADSILSSYFEIYRDNFDVSDYQMSDGGIKQLPTGNTSVEATSLILATRIGLENFDEAAMKSYLRDALKNQDLSMVNKAMALWALASAGDPVLLAIDTFIESHEVDADEELYLSLALTSLGDKTRAVEMAEHIIKGTAKLNVKEELLLASLARILEIENDLYDDNFTLTIETTESVNIEKLYYLSFVPVDFDMASITYNVGGNDEVVELPGLLAHRITLDDGQKITFSDVTGNIQITEVFEVTGLDYDSYTSQKYKLTRNMPETIGVGEIVEVSYDYEKPAKSSAFIKDMIPAGFEYAGVQGERDYSIRNVNQEMTLYLDYDSTRGNVKYYIRAIQAGNYHVESAYIKSYDGLELNMIQPTMIEVYDE